MARRLIPVPTHLSEAAALTGKRVVIQLRDYGGTIRMQTEFEPAVAEYVVTIEGEVTGYHLTRSTLVNHKEIAIAGWGMVDVGSSPTKIWRVVPPWWKRALIWLGLLERPFWF